MSSSQNMNLNHQWFLTIENPGKIFITRSYFLRIWILNGSQCYSTPVKSSSRNHDSCESWSSIVLEAGECKWNLPHADIILVDLDHQWFLTLENTDEISLRRSWFWSVWQSTTNCLRTMRSSLDTDALRAQLAMGSITSNLMHGVCISLTIFITIRFLSLFRSPVIIIIF